MSLDPRSVLQRRHHAGVSSLQRAVRAAIKASGIAKPVTPHTFGHRFSSHLLEVGYDIRTVQELLGHKYVKTTMIYTYVLQIGPMLCVILGGSGRSAETNLIFDDGGCRRRWGE